MDHKKKSSLSKFECRHFGAVGTDKLKDLGSRTVRMLLQKGNIGKGIAQPVQRRGVPSALRHAPLANKVATPAVAPQGLLRPILSERGSPALLKRQRALDVVVRAAETEQEAENAGTVVPGDGWESFPPPPYEPSEQVLDLWQQADAVCFDERVGVEMMRGTAGASSEAGWECMRHFDQWLPTGPAPGPDLCTLHACGVLAVDRTVTTDASVGLLAKFMGIEDEAQSLMEQGFVKWWVLPVSCLGCLFICVLGVVYSMTPQNGG
eukprot:649213-Pelagomonas_calceolata.AAC.6